METRYCDIVQDPESLTWYIQQFDGFCLRDPDHPENYPTRTAAATAAIKDGLQIVRFYPYEEA